MSISIRPATPDDAALIHRFVRDLAVYEKLEHEAKATPEMLAAALFRDNPHVFCDIAERDGAAAGFAIWFYTFSTFVGRHGIFLEDLFVDPAMRGHGVGKALLAGLARRCVDEGLGRLDWQVLDWNEPSIRFYEARGAVIKRAWLPVRLDGEALLALAEGRS